MYFEALDLIVNCIEGRFDQPGYRIYQSIESLLIKVCKREEWKSDLEVVSNSSLMPATNASSERSFSALRQVKTYLHTTMTQERLNYLMIIHVHKERTDALDMKTLLNEFVDKSEHRTRIFAMF